MWFPCQISSKKKKNPKQTVRFFCVENSRMESEMSLEINENIYINIYTAYKGEKTNGFSFNCQVKKQIMKTYFELPTFYFSYIRALLWRQL